MAAFRSCRGGNQIEDEDQQQNAANSETPSMAVSSIAEAAAEQEQQDQDNQDQIHPVSPLDLGCGLKTFGTVSLQCPASPKERETSEHCEQNQPTKKFDEEPKVVHGGFGCFGLCDGSGSETGERSDSISA